MAFSITMETSKLSGPILQALTSTGSATALHEPGLIITSEDGSAFQYVKCDSSGVAAVAGAPCVFAQTTTDSGFVVTPDVSDGSTAASGAFLSVLADGYYGWVQTKGLLVDAPATDGAGANVAAGDPVGATTDGVWTKITVGGTVETAGIALMAGSGGFANIRLFTL